MLVAEILWTFLVFIIIYGMPSTQFDLMEYLISTIAVWVHIPIYIQQLVFLISKTTLPANKPWVKQKMTKPKLFQLWIIMRTWNWYKLFYTERKNSCARKPMKDLNLILVRNNLGEVSTIRQKYSALQNTYQPINLSFICKDLTSVISQKPIHKLPFLIFWFSSFIKWSPLK